MLGSEVGPVRQKLPAAVVLLRIWGSYWAALPWAECVRGWGPFGAELARFVAADHFEQVPRDRV